MQNEWIQELERRLVEVETRQAVDDVHRGNVSNRLSAIEDTLRWLVRLLVGGFLMAIVSYVLRGGLLP